MRLTTVKALAKVADGLDDLLECLKADTGTVVDYTKIKLKEAVKDLKTALTVEEEDKPQ